MFVPFLPSSTQFLSRVIISNCHCHNGPFSVLSALCVQRSPMPPPVSAKLLTETPPSCSIYVLGIWLIPLSCSPTFFPTCGFVLGDGCLKVVLSGHLRDLFLLFLERFPPIINLRCKAVCIGSWAHPKPDGPFPGCTREQVSTMWVVGNSKVPL